LAFEAAPRHHRRNVELGVACGTGDEFHAARIGASRIRLEVYASQAERTQAKRSLQPSR
jgi:hypothetical protein